MIAVFVFFSPSSPRLELGFGDIKWADFDDFIEGTLLTGLSSLWPFILYGNIARSKLRKDSGKLLRVKGGTVAIAAVYALFWLVLSPLAFRDMSDPAGTAQAWAMLLFFVMPVLSAIACPIGCIIGHYVSKTRHRMNIPESERPQK